MSFRDIALPLAARGIPVTPVAANSKRAFLDDWPTSATTDPNQIDAWDRQYGSINCAAVAKGGPGDVWFFEADSPEVFDRIKKDTGHDLTSEIETFLVRSRMGRGHVYFRNTPASIMMGNLSQTYVRCGDFSCRVKNQYVVSAGSIHPHSGQPYVALNDNKVLSAPDWFIQWLMQQKVEKSPAPGGDVPKNEQGKIPAGYRHGWMVSQAGKFRHMGLSGQALEDALVNLVEQYVDFDGAAEDPIEHARKVARTFEKYEPGIVADLVLNQKPQFQMPPQVAAVAPTQEELPEFPSEAYPRFPKYVWAGTSLYENFIKPICAHNDRIDYFMWVPAATMLLNYLGTKIKIKTPLNVEQINLAQYIVLIGKRGETHKSASVDDAMEYFRYMGCLAHNGSQTKTAEGRSIVWTAGSPEGLGIEMQKTNCKNAILFYDELKTLTSKASIEGSTLTSNILTLYESKKFGNTVKSSKEAYSLDPGSYVFSLISCCTDDTFEDLWAPMNGRENGLDDRMFFVYQPEALPERRIKVSVNVLEGSIKTKERIMKAITKGEYEIENWNNPNLNTLVPLGARYTDRAVRWALAIAIDLGLEMVDDECIDRGVDIVRYEIAVKNYLRTYSAENREARLQMNIRRVLERHKGVMNERDLMRKVHADRYGSSLWGQAYYGLGKMGLAKIVQESNGSRTVYLLEKIAADE